MYATLDPRKIIDTLDTLERRIGERFPGAGLTRVCSELKRFAAENSARVKRISSPNLGLRAFILAIVVASIVLLAYLGSVIEFKRDADNLYGVMQGIDAFINVLIVGGAALIFLLTLEERLRRRRALADLHGLRSIIHVIDMHQLTKDPSHGARVGSATPSSPDRTMTAYELSRYLDYCSEMLSLAAKAAALYAQAIPDPVIIEAVADIERLTAGLSAKIWQKIMIIEQSRLATSKAQPETPAVAAETAAD
ncbi:MAG: hypothetical protein U1E49_14975 [Hyphomicrobiaceae bacterium]